jgi:hypothetical protein
VKADRDSSAADTERLRPGDFYGHAAATVAVALFLWTRMDPHAAYREMAALFWGGLGLWLVAGTLAIRARQHWWVIATLPFALYALTSLALLAACLLGDCV